MLGSIRLNALTMQNSLLSGRHFSEATQKYAKITGIIVVIFSTLAILFVIYRHYSAHKNLKVNHGNGHGNVKVKEHETPIIANSQPASPWVYPRHSLRVNSSSGLDPKEEKTISSPEKISPSTPSTPLIPGIAFDQVDNICGQIAENIFINSSYSAVKAMKTLDQRTHQQTLSLLNEIVAEFERRHWVSAKISYGNPVPKYFANVSSESNEDRKYLSLVGIRNLLMYGPQIIDDFSAQRFLGGKHHYGSYQGLNAFEFYTGNVVDLDTELDAKNDQDALAEAKQKIIHFGKRCGLSAVSAEDVADQLPDRKLSLPNLRYQHIHVASDHLDRSNYGIWKRGLISTNCHYYVNVPNCELVLVAVLKLPYLIGELAYRAKNQNDGKLPKDFFDDFFKDGLSDKCYNDKARACLDFYRDYKAKLDKVPTPQEEARKKVVNGHFGEALQKISPDIALQKAFTRSSLCDYIMDLDPHYHFGYTNNISLIDWKILEQDNIRECLKKENVWKTTLYQQEEGCDYFLLDEKTLDAGFLDQFWEYLKF